MRWLYWFGILYVIFRLVVFVSKAQPNDYLNIVVWVILIGKILLPILGFIGLCVLVAGIFKKLFS